MSAPRSAVLALEDGRIFRGYRFGASRDGAGEVVFNTSLIGYQEIVTDPSYAGQMVVMTYPMIGNYGMAQGDHEASRPFLSALIVKEPSRIASNWRSQQTLDAYLCEHDIPGLYGIDTRALVRHLVANGVQRAVIADAVPDTVAGLVERARAVPSMVGMDLASKVTRGEAYDWTEASFLAPKTVSGTSKKHVIVYDFGVKYSILRNLVDAGCTVKVVPATTSFEDVLAQKPDGVVLSNGPGDPEPLTYAVKNIQGLLGRVPVFGICLGHQLLGLACGGKTLKLKFGHHGGNHPVMDLVTRKVEITAQNHNFAVVPDTLPTKNVALTHVSLFDQSCEGLRRTDVPAMSVQYHPEGAPGPHDAHYLFQRFVDMINDAKGQS